MNRAVIVIVAVVLAGFSASCAENKSASPTTTSKSPSSVATTYTRPASTSSPGPTSTNTPTSPASEYPKFVPKSKIDKRYTQFVQGDKMVMLAPGVYAEPSPDGVLGTLDDYSAYLGNCTAIKRYSETRPGGHTCW
jgi:hypothetical protein